MDTYGMDEHAPDSDWPWNLISKHAVVYSCGMIARRNELTRHCHDPVELARCRDLADAAAGVMAGTYSGMGSESDARWEPFFVTANVGAAAPRGLTDAVVRAAFGGTIYPAAAIRVEPVEERGEWWSRVLRDCGAEGSTAWAEVLAPWRQLVTWFRRQPAFREAAFIMVGDWPMDEARRNGGNEFLRLVVGLTAGGSLVGTCTHVLYT